MYINKDNNVCSVTGRTVGLPQDTFTQDVELFGLVVAHMALSERMCLSLWILARSSAEVCQAT